MSTPSKLKFPESNATIFALILFASAAGLTIPFFVDLMNGEASKIAALPALFILVFLVWLDRKITLILIMLFRSSGDIFLESTRFSLGGYQIGVGGLLNIFVIFIALVLLVEKPKITPQKAYTMWASFLIIALYGVIVAPVKAEAIRNWLAIFTYFMIFTSAFHFVKSRENFIFCLKLVMASSIFPIIYAFFDIGINIIGGSSGDFRLQSTFSHPNIFAFYLVLLITINLYITKTQVIQLKDKTKILPTAYQILLIILLISTKTRSAWIACVITYALYAAFFERRYFIYIFFAFIGSLFIPGIFERIADLAQGNEVINYSKLNSFAWRKQLWESALEWTEPFDFILGHGLQSFKAFSPIFFPLAGYANFGAHSVYIQWLFELGIIGLLSFFWLNYKSIINLKPIAKIDPVGYLIMISIIANNLIYSFSDNMLDYLSFNWYLWFVVGAACAYANIESVAHNKIISSS